jgi:hypothetical protein
MDIKYQTTLNNNPMIKSPRTGYIKRLEPLSIDQIEGLETIYNSGNQFPVSLRELLFLAGQSCYVLDYGLNDTQQEMQDDAREWLADRNFSITRPFFVVDIHNGSDSFLFVYLDEGVDDPIVYFYMLDTNPDPDYPNLRATGSSLTALVNKRLSYLQSGINPY